MSLVFWTVSLFSIFVLNYGSYFPNDVLDRAMFLSYTQYNLPEYDLTMVRIQHCEAMGGFVVGNWCNESALDLYEVLQRLVGQSKSVTLIVDSEACAKFKDTDFWHKLNEKLRHKIRVSLRIVKGASIHR